MAFLCAPNAPDEVSGVPPGQAPLSQRTRRLALFGGILVLGFARPLADWARFAWSSSLYSYVLLTPAITLYLVWLKRRTLPSEFLPAKWAAWLLLIPPVVAVVIRGMAGGVMFDQDRLSLAVVCFLCLFWAGCCWLMGRRVVAALFFPLAFLLFMAPLPVFAERALEKFLQNASAVSTELLLVLTATPVAREGTLLTVPGRTLEVAPECSGIHSTLILLITSLLAGYLFFRRRRTIGILAVAVLFLGILRNATRIFVLTQLFLHGYPQIFDSALHHRGGPLFFAASLVPCFILIWYLHKVDGRARPSG